MNAILKPMNKSSRDGSRAKRRSDDYVSAQSLAYCEQGRLVKFEKATHWLQHEEAEKVNKLVEDFFAKEK